MLVYLRLTRMRMMAAVVLTTTLFGGISVASAEDKVERSFLDYLFKLFSADTVPQTPELSAHERATLSKLELLLQAQNCGSKSGANYTLLGLLAGARGDCTLAFWYLEQSSCMMPQSTTPLSLNAQIRAQAGDYEGADWLHCQAQRGNRRTPQLSVNTLLDRAVVNVQRGNIDFAVSAVEQAQHMLSGACYDVETVALGWLQVGIVWLDSFSNRDAAMRAWICGADAIGDAPGGTVAAKLLVDLSVRVADCCMANADADRAARYLKRAAASLDLLGAAERAQAQFRLGSRYAQLAGHDAAYAELAAIQLRPLTEQQSIPTATKGIHRDAALAYAQLLKNSDAQRANELLQQALRLTLEIGQADSAYEPVFANLPAQETIRKLDLQLRSGVAPNAK